MRLLGVILFLLFAVSLFSQSGTKPNSIQGSPYQSGILMAKKAYYDHARQDSFYIYEHVNTDSLGFGNDTLVGNEFGSALRVSDSLFYRQCPTCPFNFVTKIDTIIGNEYGNMLRSSDSLYYRECPTCGYDFISKIDTSNVNELDSFYINGAWYYRADTIDTRDSIYAVGYPNGTAIYLRDGEGEAFVFVAEKYLDGYTTTVGASGISPHNQKRINLTVLGKNGAFTPPDYGFVYDDSNYNELGESFIRNDSLFYMRCQECDEYLVGVIDTSNTNELDSIFLNGVWIGNGDTANTITVVDSIYRSLDTIFLRDGSGFVLIDTSNINELDSIFINGIWYGVGDTLNITYDGSETVVTDSTGILVTGSGTVGDPYVITNTVTDTDTDEQDLSDGGKVGNNQTIDITNGDSVTFSVADGDSSGINEIQTISTDGTPGNVGLSGSDTITINVNDADADPGNELQILSINEDTIFLSDGGYVVLPVLDTTNHLQRLDSFLIDANKLYASLDRDGVPASFVDLLPYLDNTDAQTVDSFYLQGNILRIKLQNAPVKTVDLSSIINGRVKGSGVATRVAFWASTDSLGNNPNLFWDNANNRLGVGTAIPLASIHSSSTFRVGSNLFYDQGEGGLRINTLTGISNTYNEKLSIKGSYYNPGLNYITDLTIAGPTPSAGNYNGVQGISLVSYGNGGSQMGRAIMSIIRTGNNPLDYSLAFGLSNSTGNSTPLVFGANKESAYNSGTSESSVAHKFVGNSNSSGYVAKFYNNDLSKSLTISNAGQLVVPTLTATPYTLGSWSTTGEATQLNVGTGLTISGGALVNTVTDTDTDDQSIDSIYMVGNTLRLKLEASTGKGVDLSQFVDDGHTYDLEPFADSTGFDFTEDASVKKVVKLYYEYEEFGSGSGGVTDHGDLTGLGDDDHVQYLNVARGDARYYTESESDGLLATKANVSHTHDLGDVDITGASEGDVPKIVSGVLSWAADGGGGGVSDGDKGEVIVSGSGATWLLDTGIDAAKIGGGGVSTTEYNYIGGLTSDAQTQINGKAATSHTHAVGDLTTGSATTGQVLTYNGSAWAPATPSGGSVTTQEQSGSGTVTTSYTTIADISLAAGTWKIDANASCLTNAGMDVQFELYNVGSSTILMTSRSTASAAVEYLNFGLNRLATLGSTTTIRLRAKTSNGTCTAASGENYITAIK